MYRTSRVALGAALVGALIAAASPAYASPADRSGNGDSGKPAQRSVEKVSERDLGDDWFTADTRPGGTLQFTTVGGRTAAKLSTPPADNPAKVQLLTSEFDGLKLSDISTLSYNTWRDPSSTGFVAAVPALNIRADMNSDGKVDAYLVYEPYQDLGNTAVLSGVWQTWDAIRGGQAKWWSSSGTNGCGQATPCTWTTLLAGSPNARVLEDPTSLVSKSAPTPTLNGSLGLNLGSYNPGITAGVDTLTVNNTTFDFAPAKRSDGKQSHSEKSKPESRERD